MYIERLTRLEQEMKEAKSLLKEVKMNYEKDELYHLTKVLVQRDAEIARLTAALTSIASAHKGWYANGKPMTTPETQDEYILRIRNTAQCAVEGSPAARPI